LNGWTTTLINYKLLTLAIWSREGTYEGSRGGNEYDIPLPWDEWM